MYIRTCAMYISTYICICTYMYTCICTYCLYMYLQSVLWTSVTGGNPLNSFHIQLTDITKVLYYYMYMYVLSHLRFRREDNSTPRLHTDDLRLFSIPPPLIPGHTHNTCVYIANIKQICNVYTYMLLVLHVCSHDVYVRMYMYIVHVCMRCSSLL